MGRKVYITSDMSVDERIQLVADANPLAAMAWPWLLTAFDDWGRLEASAARLKLSVFPAINEITRETVEEALQLYAREGLIVLYEVDGKRYAFIPPGKWFKYQTHIRAQKREVDGSKHPAPPADAAERASARGCAQVRAVDGNCTPSPSPSPSPSPTPTRSKPLCVPPETHGAHSALQEDVSKAGYPPEFEEFWQAYPRRVVKRAAYTAWRARLKEWLDPELGGDRITAALLIQAAQAYSAECRARQREPDKIKHPSTFLSVKHPFADYLPRGGEPSAKATDPAAQKPKDWYGRFGKPDDTAAEDLR